MNEGQDPDAKPVEEPSPSPEAPANADPEDATTPQGAEGTETTPPDAANATEAKDGENGPPPPPDGSVTAEEQEDEGGMSEGEDEGAMDKPTSAEEQEAEEAEFRAKYAIDIDPTEEEEGLDDEEEEESYELEAPPPDPTEDQMSALIRYLEQEEIGEYGEEEEDENDEEEQTEELYKKCEWDPKAPPTVEEGEQNVMVLGPDHPKMARFQAALKAHLQRQIYAAEMEIRQMENDLKMKKKERTDLGTNLYQLQHEILRQKETCEKYDKEMAKMRDKRETVEEMTKELRDVLKGMRIEMQKEEEREMSLRESVKTLDYTEHVVKQAAEKYEGELKIRELVGEKLEKMRGKAEAEKRDQDFYLDKVLTHVQHMEMINAGIKRQIQAHQEEQAQLNTYINEAVTEIEALQIEKNHLQRAWNDTISVVRARDEALNAARDTLQQIFEDLRIRESELRAVTKLIAKEQEGHERSVILLRRRKMEEKVLKRQLAKLEDENNRLKEELAELSKVRKAVEMDLLRANNTVYRKNKEASAPRRQIEQLSLEKIRLEDQILTILQDQSGLSKAAAHLQALIREARTKTRQMENEVSKVENENSTLAVEVEKLRAEMWRKSTTLNELEKRCQEQERYLAEQLKDIQQSERLMEKKTWDIAKLNRKLEKLINAQGGVELGPLEREIAELEKNIATEKDEVAKLEEEWLKKQDELVTLTTQRDYLIQQNELLRKEIFVMERKRQRLDSEVEKKRMEVSRVKKATEAVICEISSVNAKLHLDRTSHDQLEKDNILIHNDLVALLKDAEMEALELERDIETLEMDKSMLINQLHEVHEQNLQWEKKVRLAKELKDNIKQEQEGSNSALKLDIHHMKVRYNEILRAQEKLMGDLERCIDRRDRIIAQADMQLQRNQKNARHTKLNIQRNFASIKERNRILSKEVGEIEMTVQDTMDHISELEERWENASNELNQIKERIKSCEDQVAEASIQKHKNLVEIVLRQEKFRILEAIRYNRYKPAGRTMDELDALLQEVECDCYSILQLTDEIAANFPEAATHLRLVRASILPSAK